MASAVVGVGRAVASTDGRVVERTRDGSSGTNSQRFRARLFTKLVGIQARVVIDAVATVIGSVRAADFGAKGPQQHVDHGELADGAQNDNPNAVKAKGLDRSWRVRQKNRDNPYQSATTAAAALVMMHHPAGWTTICVSRRVTTRSPAKCIVFHARAHNGCCTCVVVAPQCCLRVGSKER